MFTGIVEEVGIVQKAEDKESLFEFQVSASKVLKGIKVADSICVDGVCLTVTGKSKTSFTFDLMRETFLTTTLSQLKEGSIVNLERALRVNDRLSGHFVTGHIDEVGIIRNRLADANNIELHIAASRNLKKYIVPKGSVCIDGISLTVGDVREHFFAVHLIPYTKNVTTLGFKKKGDKVNIEADILAKYVTRI